MTSVPLVQIENISKSFIKPNDEKVLVLEDFSLNLKKGETVTLFGPNGCGKSTLLSLLANLETIDHGKIKRSWRSNERNAVGFVFQQYGDILHPWRTVLKNVELPLEIKGMAKKKRRKRSIERLAHFGLEEHADKYIYQLSGGQRQLVAFCQATVFRPKLLLCDEPFSAMDYSVSRRLWLQLREFLNEQEIATVFVSHDIDEAIFLGDRVCVLSPRPAKIVMEIKISFGKKRKLNILETEKFFEIRKSVLKAFEGRGGKK